MVAARDPRVLEARGVHVDASQRETSRTGDNGLGCLPPRSYERPVGALRTIKETTFFLRQLLG